MIIIIITVAPFSKDCVERCDSDDDDHYYHHSGTPL